MKVAAIFALVVCSVYAAPALHAVDWAKVGAEVSAIEALVTSAVGEIRSIANNDNAAVGAQVGAKLDAAAVKAKAVLTKAGDAIKAQTLTVAQAEGFFGELKDILAGVQGDLQTELSNLSSAASGKIRDIFYATYAEAEKKAQTVYGLLKATTVLAVDWAKVGTEVSSIEALVQGAVAEIRTLANNDNAQVGAQIGAKLDTAAVKARTVLTKASDAIKAQTLTVAQAQAFFAELKDILANLQGDVQNELSLLSPAAASKIRDIFYNTYAEAEKRAQVVYGLLAAKAILAVDWAKVGAEVSSIEALVTSAVGEIRSIANNDNAAVGAQVGAKLDAAAVKAKAVLTKASDAIKAQTLTVAQAEGFFGELKDILAGVQGDLQTELSNLSSAASGKIRDIFYATYAEAEKKAQNCYALLRA